MSDIALRSVPSSTQGVSVVNPERAIIFPHIAAATIAAGQSVYVNSSGQVDLCSSGAAGTKQFRGIALESVSPGQGVSVCYEGVMEGYAIDALAFDALVYQSDTAGSLATAAGTATVQVGRVQARANTDSSGTIRKCLLIRCQIPTNW